MINNKKITETCKLKQKFAYKFFHRDLAKYFLFLGLVISILNLFLFKRLSFLKVIPGVLLYIIISTGIFWTIGLRMEKLLYYTNIDFQTSLYNRKYLEEELRLNLESIEKKKEPMSMCIIDIDNFKDINDNYGHLKGDEAIIKIASIFKNTFGKKDTVSRWGGDEFVIVMPNSDEFQSLKILKQLQEEVLLTDITISVGLITTYKKISLEEILAKGDKALYKAKKKGNSIFSANVIS